MLTPGTRCWLCSTDVQSTAAETTPSASPIDLGHSFSLASLLLFITLVSVILGLFTIGPGLAVVLGLIMITAWVRTSAVARHRLRQGEPVPQAERLQLFLASFGVSVGLMAIACVSGCAAFFAACFACFGTFSVLESLAGDSAAMVTAYMVFAVVGLAILIPTAWWICVTIQRRWRRDTQSPRGTRRPNTKDGESMKADD